MNSPDNSKAVITTIIPTYHRPKLLGRAIRSVLNQTYPYFKICVYDNASGDETAEVVSEIAKHDSRVSYYCHKENIGLVNNFIFGMEHIETPFFSFLSDDDIVLPWFFETVMQGFDKFPQAIFSAGATIHMTAKGEVVGVPLSEWIREGYYMPPEGLYAMVGGKHPEWTAILFRKEIIEKVGILDKNIGYPMDLDYELRASAQLPFVITKKPCAIFSVPDSSSLGHTFEDAQSLTHGYHKMIDNLRENKFLSAEVKDQATEKLLVWLRWMIFWGGAKLIQEKRYDIVYSIADSLYTVLNSKSRAILLYSIAWFRHYFPVGYYIIIGLNKFRHLSMHNNENNTMHEQLQKQHGHYSIFLNM
jgi:glycosyltransferase involved in cell wall biosynthesis